MKDLTYDLDSFEVKIEKQVRVRDMIIDLPIKYRCEAINAVFPISTKEAKKIIDCPKLRPVEILPGKSLLTITVLNFYSSPVGPFREVTYSLCIRYNSRFALPFIDVPFSMLTKKLGFIPISVNQTTEIAIESGNIISGFPHYEELINVDFNRDDKFIYVKSSCDNEEILQLQIEKPTKEKIKHETYKPYSIIDNKICQLRLDIYGVVGKSKLHNLELGSHEKAELLKKLKMSSKSLFVEYSRDMLKIVYPPIEIDTV